MQERSGTLWPLPKRWAWRVAFLAFDKRTVPGPVLELHGWARPECSQGLSYREVRRGESGAPLLEQAQWCATQPQGQGETPEAHLGRQRTPCPLGAPAGTGASCCHFLLSLCSFTSDPLGLEEWGALQKGS